MEETEQSYITITDESDTEIILEVLGRVEYKGKRYVALLPAEYESDELVILRDDGNESMAGIDDAAELDAVYREFVRILDSDGEE